ncbi:multicopper oxidase family protein [Arthrobacter sp. NPDC056727]|uniref:multicopper oxidase family protein n=1 Tax=Arthrobacter sp. NPDC056727 TaxID=3345927 RepID=UPI0036700163
MASRREVLKLGVVGAAMTGVLAGGAEPTATEPITQSQLAPQNRPVPFRAVFRRPPELVPFQKGFDGGDPKRPFERYALTQKLGQARMLPGLTTTLAGYNGIFPGPTIRARQGTRIEVRIRNAFPSQGLVQQGTPSTSTHLHGSASLPQYDGYANDITVPGFFKNYHYPNRQTSRTLWYHDHKHHITAQNVYSGLAGFYPLSDRFERAQLPQGEFDVPLMISDALFQADGSLGYNDNGQKGLWGDIILVNGVPWPTMKVKPRIYRFRVLDASISRSYRPTLSNGEPIYIVGTDAGMTPVVQAVSSWRQGTAERTEILIDFRKYRTGQTVDLRNLSNKNNLDFANTEKIMRFQVVADSGSGAGSISAIPTRLDNGGSPRASQGGIDTMSLTLAMATVKRQLRFERENGQWSINGVLWDDIERSGFTLLFGNPRPFAVEQWTIVNQSGGWFHPVHIHLIDAKIIARNTNGGKPFAWELGPKDVFYAGENESITALMQFDSTPQEGGRYMIHCHNLVHEDHDMMVQYAVGDLRTNNPITADPPRRDPLSASAFPPVYRPLFPAGT